ncbi:MAG: LemA family protein [Zymomonas mobilis]|uniref:LemA protein n=1 Tax=Zymomonas mobilis TaxID=542 RepID=A0A542W1I9_ZYMMB|nr:LemA family protein [Zymomonas mobilis]TQL17436.1 LemA protein [Zymomonas mobilis]
MSLLRRASPFLLAPVAIVSLSSCGINQIPASEENAKARWADVQNEYQRRADLIPNLVATVKGYATHEKDVLTAVTEARAKATSMNVTVDNPDSMKQFAEAQGHLSMALGRLMSVREQYPQLQADQNFLALQAQLEGTENRITIARRDYNEAVQQYNTLVRTFPNAIGAKIFYGAKPMVPYEATATNAQSAPTVSFDAPAAPATSNTQK